MNQLGIWMFVVAVMAMGGCKNFTAYEESEPDLRPSPPRDMRIAPPPDLSPLPVTKSFTDFSAKPGSGWQWSSGDCDGTWSSLMGDTPPWTMSTTGQMGAKSNLNCTLQATYEIMHNKAAVQVSYSSTLRGSELPSSVEFSISSQLTSMNLISFVDTDDRSLNTDYFTFKNDNPNGGSENVYISISFDMHSSSSWSLYEIKIIDGVD